MKQLIIFISDGLFALACSLGFETVKYTYVDADRGGRRGENAAAAASRSKTDDFAALLTEFGFAKSPVFKDYLEAYKQQTQIDNGDDEK